MQRRELILGLAGLSALSALPLAGCNFTSTNQAAYVSASKVGKDFYLSVLNQRHQLLSQHKLPARGHATACCSKQPSLVAVARRPGDWLVIIDLEDPQAPNQVIKPGKHRHYFGHAVFDESQNYLYTTENDFLRGRGVIGVYERLSDYKKVAEFESYGIGPHELKFLPDSDLLIVANGGILTYPDQPRKKLNLDTMHSSLVYIHAKTGQLIDQVYASHPQSSLRHFDILPDKTVAVGIQQQTVGFSHIASTVPLIVTHRMNETLQNLSADEAHWRKYQAYVAGIRAHNREPIVCATTPRGHLASFWHLSSRRLISQVNLEDVSGVVFDDQRQRFMLTTGYGKVAVVDHLTGQVERLVNVDDVQWDNHAYTI